jgi:hypothetical protein
VVRIVAIGLFALAGCVDEFKGSNVQVEFSPAMPAQASPSAAVPGADELPADTHYRLYAIEEATDSAGNAIEHLFELQRFEIHRVIDLASPCFIDVGDHVPFPGLHVSQFAAKMREYTRIDDVTNPPPGATDEQLIDVATAMQRQMNVAALAGPSGPKAVSSASSGGYGAFAAACSATDGFPPADCSDRASNERRLALCSSAWNRDAALFEGTDRVLTAPLNGTTHGFVTGMNPINLAPVGGAQFFVDEALEDLDAYAIYWQHDGASDNQPGELVMFGRPTKPTRGVMRVHMTSISTPSLTADLAIFANLDEDEVRF